jgi:tetratricopeptide (TPR) repeat protein
VGAAKRRLSVPTQGSQASGRKRYPGARPFSDSPEDRQIFFGRDADIDRLFERMLGARLLVFFGQSGLGKTSLLMAGVFPRLREKQFLPIPIRLNRPGAPADIVIEAMTDACERAGAELTAGDAAGLWEFLRTSLIWQGDLLLTPVLVFDQFEEIFTLRDAEFRTELAADLGTLASGIPPVRPRLADGRGGERRARFGERPPEVKILLSLREEYLGALQELSGAIPGLFQERVRLAPLAEDDARLAICKPAAARGEPGGIPFATPLFEYEPGALVEMLEFLRGESRIIEPVQLQLLCCRAEEIVAARAAEAAAEDSGAESEKGPPVLAPDATTETPAIRITSGDLGGPAGMKGVLRQFYRHVIGMLSWRDRFRARRLCEEGLLNRTGARLMLDKTQIESEYHVSAAGLATLVDERLLRREQRLESLFYEISHDQLANSIQQSRPFRIPKKLRQALRGAAAVALVTIVLLIVWIWQVDQARKAADRARTDAEDLVAFLIGESLLEKLRPVGRNAILEEVQGKVDLYLDTSRPHELTPLDQLLMNLRNMVGANPPHPDERTPLDQLRHLRARGLALRNAGDILRSRGDLAKAVAKFQESGGAFERLARAAPGSPEPRAERARSLDRLGDAMLDQGKITESLETHRAALATREALYDEDRGVASSLDLADSHSAVGRVLNDMGRPRQALVQLDRARDLLRAVEMPTSRSPRVLKALHDAADNRASALRLIGDASGARGAYREALKITQEWLQRYPLSADARVRQVIAASRLANEQMDRGAVVKALEQFGQINRTLDELVRWDDTNALWKRDFAAALILMAEARSAVGQAKEAQAAYDKALKFLEGLAEIDSSNSALKQDLHWLYQSRGRLALERKQWKRATDDFTASERYINEAARVDAAFVTWQREKCWVSFDLARARSGAREYGQAVALLRQSRDLVSALIVAAPEATAFHEDLAIFYSQEVRALEESGRRDLAAEVARERSRAVMGALAAQPQNTWLLNEALSEDLRAGDDMKEAGRLDDAAAAYRLGLAKIARAEELEPGNVTWWEAARIAHMRLGDALFEGKRWGDAEAAYRNGIAPGEKAFAIAPHRADLANGVFLMRLALGDTLKANGKPESALAEFEHARDWIRKASELDARSSVYFNNRRAMYLRVAQIKGTLKAVDGAETAYRAAAEAGERGVALAETPDRKAEFANNVHLVHVEWGEWYRGRNDLRAALQHYDAARPWLDGAMAAAPGKSVYADYLGVLYRHIGTAKRAMGDLEGAESAFRASIDAAHRSESVAANEGFSEQARRASSLHYAQKALAEFLESRRDVAGALTAYGSALESLNRAVRLDRKAAAYPDAMRIVYRERARLEEDAGNTSTAGAALRAAVEAGRRAAALDNSAYYLNRAGQALFDLGDFYKRVGSPDEALAAFEGAASQVERAIKLNAKSELYYENLSTAQRRIGELREGAKDVGSARVAHEAAVRAGRRATDLASDSGEPWRILYQAQWALALNIERAGNREGAQRQLRNALKTAEQAARLLPEDRAVRDDVATLRALVDEGGGR